MTRDQSHSWIASALSLASDTQELRLGPGAIRETSDVFGRCFGDRRAVIVADANTFEPAGRRVADVIRGARLGMMGPFVFTEPHLHAQVGGRRRKTCEER